MTRDELISTLARMNYHGEEYHEESGALRMHILDGDDSIATLSNLIRCAREIVSNA